MIEDENRIDMEDVSKKASKFGFDVADTAIGLRNELAKIAGNAQANLIAVNGIVNALSRIVVVNLTVALHKDDDEDIAWRSTVMDETVRSINETLAVIFAKFLGDDANVTTTTREIVDKYDLVDMLVHLRSCKDSHEEDPACETCAKIKHTITLIDRDATNG